MQKRLSRIVKALPFRQRSKAETRRRRARRQDQMLQERTRFERRIQTADRRLRRSIARFLRESSIPNLLTAPMIYSLIAPLVLMDIWISLYQWVCFRVYGVPRVRRQDYLIIDRHRLGYLNAIEKLNCVYCGYANGLFAYLREIAGRTEQVPGVRSSTRGRSGSRTHVTHGFSSMATRRGTMSAWRGCGRCGTIRRRGVRRAESERSGDLYGAILNRITPPEPTNSAGVVLRFAVGHPVLG